MSKELINYIVQMVNQGYKIDQISSFLKNSGYDSKDVDKSINVATDMTSKSYIDYIDSQVKAGFKLPVIRNSLIQQGYDYRVVDYAMNHYHTNFAKNPLFKSIKELLHIPNTKDVHLTMEVENLIKENLSQGFTLENIQSSLLQKGYDTSIVNKEISKFHQSHMHIPKQSAYLFISIILAIIIISSIFFVPSMFNGLRFSSNTKTEPRLLDLSVENAFPKQDLFADDDIHFVMDIDNMGYERDFDIDFFYILENLDGKVLRKSSETKSSASSLTAKLNIPSTTDPGRYILSVRAEYKGETKAQASFDFYVLSKDGSSKENNLNLNQEKQKQNTQPDNDDNNNQASQENTPINKLPEPEVSQEDVNVFMNNYYGNRNKLTTAEKNKLQNAIDNEGEKYAMYLCRKIKDSILETECKLYVISMTGNYDGCNQLKDSKRDLCYVEFSKTSSNNSICTNIISKQMKTLCKMYVLKNANKELSKITDKEEYYKKLSQSLSTDS